MANDKRLKTKGGAAVNNASSFLFYDICSIKGIKKQREFHAVFYR